MIDCPEALDAASGETRNRMGMLCLLSKTGAVHSCAAIFSPSSVSYANHGYGSTKKNGSIMCA